MTPSQFDIHCFSAKVDGSRVDLFRSGEHMATVTFRPSGVFSIVERGRGDAGRLPAQYANNIEAATDYVIRSFWSSLPVQQAA